MTAVDPNFLDRVVLNTTYGAAAMTDKHRGLSTLLAAKFHDAVEQYWCCAHRLNLKVGYALDPCGDYKFGLFVKSNDPEAIVKRTHFEYDFKAARFNLTSVLRRKKTLRKDMGDQGTNSHSIVRKQQI